MPKRKRAPMLLAAALAFQTSFFDLVACSSEYLIWMIRSPSADPLYRFVVNGKAGYVDALGNVLIPPKFRVTGNFGGEFHDGLLQIDSPGGVYFDQTGEVALDAKSVRSDGFSEGLAVAMRSGGDKFGYIDKQGNFVIEPQFESYPHGSAHPFREGLARIMVGSKVGFIDRSGRFVVPPQFLEANQFSDGLSRVVVEGPCAFQPDGPCGLFNIVSLPHQRPRRIDLQKELPPCRFTFIDRSGRIVLAQRFQRAQDFSEGLAAVSIDGLWGYIDKSGAVAIPPRFGSAGPFSQGLARVKLPAEMDEDAPLYGYIDRSGQFRIEPRFRDAGHFRDGLAAVKSPGDFYHYVDRRGDEAFSERFLLATHFYGGLAHVQLIVPDGSPSAFAYIDTSGRKVFRYEPGQASPDEP